MADIKLQNDHQCTLCAGCQDDSEFDYCRACGFTIQTICVKREEKKLTPLEKAIIKARGGPAPPVHMISF